MEAIRFAELVRKGGTAVVNDMAVVPITVSSGKGIYPGDEHLPRLFGELGAKLLMVPGEKLALESGTIKAANVVLLGAVSRLLPLEEALWWQCLSQRIPAKFLDINQKAFALGRAAAAETVAG